MRTSSAMVLVLGMVLAAPARGETSQPDCGPADDVCVMDQLESAVAKGDLVAKIDLARTLLDEAEKPASWRRAAILLQQAAATGDAWSSSILAGLYIQGKGVPQDGRKVLGLLVPLAAEGSIGALSGLGDLFAKGAGTVAADLPRAARYYARAAAGGDVHGKYQLALMLLDGDGVPADVPKAVGLLEELSAAGDPWILIQLADVYASGKANPAERAIDYFRDAAATGNSAAMVRLAQVYQSGIGSVAPDATEAAELLEKAAGLGDVAGQVLLAQMLLANGEAGATTRAVDLLEQASAKGEVWPATILADLYARGTKVAPNGPRAVKLLQPFIDQGNAAALVGLGDVYAKGPAGIPTDLPLARELFTRAAATGDLSAMNRLGFMLLRGQGGEMDAVRGLELLEPVMASDDTWAMLQLADLYAEGVALPMDAAKAQHYYERAAELGNAAGLSRLGSLYRSGLGGIGADRATALDYFERAVAANDGAGRIYLALMLLEEGVSQDIDRAVQLLDAAAKTGDAWATTILADMLIRGDKIDADGARALALLKPLADQNNAAALASLGNLYASGAGAIAADPVKAGGYFEAAAALGDFGAKSRLGMMLVRGDGIKAEPARGLALLQDVADIGDGWAKIQLGDVLAAGESVPIDAEAALAAYRAARDSGLAAGAIKLGNLYLTGKGDVASDPVQAAAYFAEAAESGESVGQINLALLLLNGKGVEQDVDHALGLLKLAAGSGDAWANGVLGGLYADGRHLTPDYEHARMFSAAAQTAGDDSAMLRLGVLLAVGPLAGEHRAEGLNLVEAAVSAGVPNAVVERARLQMMGLAGNNGGLAAKDGLLAELDQGNPAALRLLLQLYRAGGPGLDASPRQAQSLLDAHSALLTPEAVAFETIALRGASAASEQSLAAIGTALGGVARTDLSQIAQMLFWGNKNAYVYVLQHGLRDAGFYNGPLSGYLTRETISAINHVCRELGAEQACMQGPLTPDVAVLLGNYLANRPQTLRS